MRISKRFGIIALAWIVGITTLEGVSRVSDSRVPGFVTEAGAVVGRPLTPVSVAGVGRRTVRRCAAGVYNC